MKSSIKKIYTSQIIFPRTSLPHRDKMVCMNNGVNQLAERNACAKEREGEKEGQLGKRNGTAACF